MINVEINNDLKKQFDKEGFIILPHFLDKTKITDIAKKFKSLFSGIFETGIGEREEILIMSQDKFVMAGNQT